MGGGQVVISEICEGQVSMGYGNPRPARDRVGGRVGRRATVLSTFTIAYHSPPVLATLPRDHPISLPFDPPLRRRRRRHSTCDATPPTRGLAVAISITITIVKAPCRGPYLRTSLFP